MGAYPNIAGGGQWTSLVFYDNQKGWDGELCSSVPSLCKILRGKMKTESGRGLAWNKKRLLGKDYELVGVFRVRGAGHAHLHNGVDARVNVHLCLLNCHGSRIIVAGEPKDYYDGSLFA